MDALNLTLNATHIISLIVAIAGASGYISYAKSKIDSDLLFIHKEIKKLCEQNVTNKKYLKNSDGSIICWRNSRLCRIIRSSELKRWKVIEHTRVSVNQAIHK